MKKRIGKFFIILGVIFFCLTPFYYVHGEDYYHYNTFNVLDEHGNQIGSGEYVLYQDFMVAHERTYVSEITINFAAYYRGPVTVARRTIQSDYILVEGASISSGSDSNITFWLAGSNYVHIKWYSASDFNYSGYYPLDVFTTGLTLVEMSPGESRQEIIDALDTSNGNWTSLLQQMNDIKNLFGNGNIQNVDVDSIRGMLNTIRSEILVIGGLDAVIATKVGELSGIADNIELLLEQIGYIAANVQIITDNMDLSDLEQAVDDLTAAINTLSGSINITNNIDLSMISPISLNAFMYFSRLSGGTYGLNSYNYPYYRVVVDSNDVAGAYATARRIYVPAGATYLLAFFSTVDFNGTNMPSYKQNASSDFTISRTQDRFVNFILEKIFITNNGNSTAAMSFDFNAGSTCSIIPLFLGDVNSMSSDTQQLVQYKVPTDNDTYYTYFDSIIDLLEEQQDFNNGDLMDKFDDVIAAINHISINVDYNTVNQTVNNFNVDINTVHNTETNILTSFNTYRQRFHTDVLDSSDWFSTTLFNYIFNNVWTTSNSHIGWIITLILFCVLILAVMGLRK